jgi:Ca2+-binding RTX toxin-like protein
MKPVAISFFASSAIMLGAAVSVAQPAPASVYVADGAVLRHIASDGQTNVVTISDSGSKVIVRDTAGLAAGEGCKQTNAVTVSCQRPTNTIVLDLKDGNDILNTTSTVPVNAYGGDGNDVLNGGPANDGLFGDGGDDVVNGNDGNDAMSGGSGNDIINGGPGDDNVIYEPEGNDTISGGPGNDIISDSGGTDNIAGGPGDDTIYATDGAADVIDCGPGNDKYLIDTNDVRFACETNLRN